MAAVAAAQDELPHELMDVETTPAHLLAMAVFPLLGLLFVLGIIAIVNYNEYRQEQARLASIERLIAAGQPVPRELIAPKLARLTLAEQYRRDMRRGITLLVWAIGVALVFYFTSGGQWRPAAWGFLFLLPSLGNFGKAWLTRREMARGGDGTPQT
jgi:hypothetical protein